MIHNIKQFRKLAQKGTCLSVAVKGNAYGHGLTETIDTLEPYVDYFQIDSIEELITLRKRSKKKILLLGYVQKSDLLQAVKLGCILSVFSFTELRETEKIASKEGKVQEIHIPVDAYLGREGFLLKDLPILFKEIQGSKHLKCTGIYAHFANIEDTVDFSHAKKQINEFRKAVIMAEEFGFNNLITHISATSGLLVYEKNLGINPLIRLGIGVYGMWPSEHLREIYAKIRKNKLFLRPALSWKTKIAAIKILPKGNTIGYGLTYRTAKVTKVALIPQGYADGLDRRLSNNGFMLVGGKRCRILGRVMMNMTVIDVSHLKQVKNEDEVVILGCQGKEYISAEEIAARIGTINYEITTRISPLLPRVII